MNRNRPLGEPLDRCPSIGVCRRTMAVRDETDNEGTKQGEVLTVE